MVEQVLKQTNTPGVDNEVGTLDTYNTPQLRLRGVAQPLLDVHLYRRSIHPQTLALLRCTQLYDIGGARRFNLKAELEAAPRTSFAFALT